MRDKRPDDQDVLPNFHLISFIYIDLLYSISISVTRSYFMNPACYSFIRLTVWLGSQSPDSQSQKANLEDTNQSWQSPVGIPFATSLHLQNRVNSLFREMNEGDSPLTTASFVPAVDVYEDAKKVVLKLEVPGIEEKDLDVRVENNTLTVKGERKFEKDEKEENFHRIERRYGSFYRAFTLPSTVDTENVQASYNAGVLKLELSKKAEAQPKQIKVNVGGQKLEDKKEERELVGAR